MIHGELPSDVVVDRSTAEFDATTVPAGLLRAHRVAPGVWAVLHVAGGEVTFVFEDDPSAPVRLAAGDAMVIPPETPHHVEPGDDARFRVEFHRPAD